jgi:hypothetical protein
MLGGGGVMRGDFPQGAQLNLDVAVQVAFEKANSETRRSLYRFKG